MQPACEGPVATSRWAARPRLPKSNREYVLIKLRGLPILCGQHVACSPTPGSGDTRQATIWSPRMRKFPAFCLAILQSALLLSVPAASHAQEASPIPAPGGIGPYFYGRRATSTPSGPRLSRASFLESRHTDARPSGSAGAQGNAARPWAQRFLTRTRHGDAGHGWTWGRRAVSVLGNLVSQYLGPGPRCEMGACRAGFVGDVSRLDGRAERGDVYGRR